MNEKQKEKQSILSKNFAKKLKRLRQERSWSQAQLARRIGADADRISKYERNVLWPTLELTGRIAKEFNVSLDYLVWDDHATDTYKIGNPDLLKRLAQMELLSPSDQKTLIDVLDAFITRHQIGALVHHKTG